MTNKEKQLLLKDLCARLPYGVICNTNEINLDGELLFINKVYNIVALYNDKAIGGKFNTCQIANIKPYFRPMSSMTKEEREEIVKLHIDDRITSNIEICDANCVDFYNSHHLDYRGLIPMGLALEAPEDMYKSK